MEKAPPCFNPSVRIQKGTVDTINGDVVYFPRKATATCNSNSKPESCHGRCGVRWVSDNIFRGACPAFNNEVVELEAPQLVMDRIYTELERQNIDNLSYS